LKVHRAYTIVIHDSSAAILRRFRVTRRILIGLLAGTVSLSTFGAICGVVLPAALLSAWTLSARVDRLEVRNQILLEEKQRLEGLAAEVGDRLAQFEADSLRLRALAESNGAKLPAVPRSGGPAAAPVADEADTDLTGIEAYEQLEARAEQIESRLSQIENTLLTQAQRLAELPTGRPCPGDYGDGFGWRRDPFTGDPDFHQGLDIRAPWGTPIRAAADGDVSHAGYAVGYGVSVYLEHAQGIETRYGHMSWMSVREGEKVTAGQVIGYVGSTGRSSGPHLHYETLVDGIRINPVRFLSRKR